MNEITINWHIIQKCNYKCTYCFAKYEKYEKKEVHESKEKIEILLNNIYSYFSKKYDGCTIRLNLAGGEPLLSRNFDFIIKKAYKVGFKVSIITNSSKLTTKFIESNAKYIFMFATSIDSITNNTNIDIGRVSKNEVIKVSHIIKNIELLRDLNKDIKIKINTVVNTNNYTEFLGDFIDLIKPYKWKVLQALSLTDKVYCTDKQFNKFLDNHKQVKTKIFKETNEDMRDSYIMIDPYGRFYQNSSGDYTYSDSILDIDINNAFKQINFDINKFNNRYIEEITNV
jgi:radical S-adenosyl methionine domain-containing protein 2